VVTRTLVILNVKHSGGALEATANPSSSKAGRVAGACYVNARDEVTVAGPHGTPPHAARISAGYCGEYSTNQLAAMNTVESTPRISFLLCSVASCYVHESSQIEREKRNKKKDQRKLNQITELAAMFSRCNMTEPIIFKAEMNLNKMVLKHNSH
jgi:hypothetical protein